ncbi:hypothetical protein NL676_003709 [Syzygium grande]|nr:hypothetical protein NL676_003709 [Syzygium grande]
MEAITGEVRRIKVLYFLGHGRGSGAGVEQPHLFCANHSSSNDLLLKDFKRWLADLRGSHLTEAFSWSYKRRYKTGYIWQEAVDDDLVMPTSVMSMSSKDVKKFPSLLLSCSHNDEASAGNKVSSSREEIRHKYPHSSQTESPTFLQHYSILSSDTSTFTIKSGHLEDDEEHFGMSDPDNHSHCHTSFKNNGEM